MNDPLILQAGDLHLVFGMRWFAVLAERSGRAVRRLARQYRATHALRAGTVPAAIGLARLVHAGTLHSAAQIVAAQYPTGTIALRMGLGGGLTWLIAIHEGLVIARTDRLFHDPEDAARLLAELRLAYPALAEPAPDAAVGQLDLAQLAQHAGPQNQLLTLRRWRIPFSWPLRIFAGTLAAALLLPRLGNKATPESVSPHIDDTPVEESVRAAHNARAEAAARTPVHGVQGLKDLLATFHGLPLHPVGWALSQAHCASQDASAWRCNAHYVRQAPHANNDGLLSYFESQCLVRTLGGPPAGEPAGGCAWPAIQFAFVSLDEARMSWQPKVSTTPLLRTRIAWPADNDRQLLSSLQALQRAFVDIRVGDTVVSSHAPYGGMSSAAISATGFQTRALHFSGPLRSAALLPEHAGAMSWRRAELRHQRQITPDVRRSRLHITLEGVLYERFDSSESPVPSPSIEAAESMPADITAVGQGT